MATGDLGGNIARLQRELKQIKFASPLDEVGCVPWRAAEEGWELRASAAVTAHRGAPRRRRRRPASRRCAGRCGCAAGAARQVGAARRSAALGCEGRERARELSARQQHARSAPRAPGRLRLGDPVALLPLLNFSLLKFSKHVARSISQAGFEVRGPARRLPGRKRRRYSTALPPLFLHWCTLAALARCDGCKTEGPGVGKLSALRALLGAARVCRRRPAPS
jgi:hypothetical protein